MGPSRAVAGDAAEKWAEETIRVAPFAGPATLYVIEGGKRIVIGGCVFLGLPFGAAAAAGALTLGGLLIPTSLQSEICPIHSNLRLDDPRLRQFRVKVCSHQSVDCVHAEALARAATLRQGMALPRAPRSDDYFGDGELSKFFAAMNEGTFKSSTANESLELIVNQAEQSPPSGGSGTPKKFEMTPDDELELYQQKKAGAPLEPNELPVLINLLNQSHVFLKLARAFESALDWHDIEVSDRVSYYRGLAWNDFLTAVQFYSFARQFVGLREALAHVLINSSNFINALDPYFTPGTRDYYIRDPVLNLNYAMLRREFETLWLTPPPNSALAQYRSSEITVPTEINQQVDYARRRGVLPASLPVRTSRSFGENVDHLRVGLVLSSMLRAIKPIEGKTAVNIQTWADDEYMRLVVNVDLPDITLHAARQDNTGFTQPEGEPIMVDVETLAPPKLGSGRIAFTTKFKIGEFLHQTRPFREIGERMK